MRGVIPALLGAGKELDIVGDDVHRRALGSVLRVVGANLDLADHADLAALGKIPGAEVAELAPRRDVEEIDVRLTFGFPAAIDRQAEGTKRRALGRGAGLRVPGKVSDQNNLIHASHPLSLVRSQASVAGASAATGASSAAGASSATGAAGRTGMARGFTLVCFSSRRMTR